jgi:alpha-galactosidase
MRFGAFLLLTHALAFAQSDVTGYWKFSVPNGGISYLELKQTGESLTATTRGGRPLTLTGTLHDGKLHLEGSRPGGNRTVTFDGVRTKDGFNVTGNTPNGDQANGTLERVTREEAFPARLPLPDLRDLPDNGLVRTPPMGWNSWNKYHDHFDDATVRQMADAMVASGMDKVGYTYIIVDEGWSSYRDHNGKITGNARFPDMKALAD